MSSEISHTRTSSSSSTTIPQDSSSRKTNSLAVTGLPKELFEPHLLIHLYNHFQSYGTINQWVPLPGFGRILVVYEDEDTAEKAKVCSDPIFLNATEDRQELTLRVYRADSNPLVSKSMNNENHFLQPPVPTLPRSPPPVEPRLAPLADDLISALKNLQLQQAHSRRSSVEVLMDATESGVSVVLEDCDFATDGSTATWEEVYEGSRMCGVAAPSRTMWDYPQLFASMPPLRSSMSVPVY